MLLKEFELFEDQKKFVVDIRAGIMKYKRIIACAATGSGKTKVFCTIAVAAIARGRTVLIISESRKLFNQINKEITAHEIKAGNLDQVIVPNRIYLAMAQTLSLRPHLIDQFNLLNDRLLVINDECHIGTSTKIIKKLPECLLMGFTATPDAKTGKHLPKLYNNIVIGPQAHDLVLAGRLCPYKHFARQKADLSHLQVNSMGEFTEDSQQQAFQTRLVYDGLMDDLRTAPYKKCLVFTSSIKHCNDLTAELRANGFKCVPVHSGLPAAEEAYNLNQFMNGLMPICVSVAILTKGFDFPEIDMIVLHRATTSLALYNQMCGRGSRVSPGKERWTVLDYGENYLRHDVWDYTHDWATLWKQTKKPKKKGVAPVKNCPTCQYIMPATTMTCPNCGYEYPRTHQGMELVDKKESELIEVTRAYQALVGRRISELTPVELAVYAKMKNKKLYAIRVAKAQELKTDGFLDRFAAAMHYKPSWVWMQHREMNGTTKIEYQDFVLR